MIVCPLHGWERASIDQAASACMSETENLSLSRGWILYALVRDMVTLRLLGIHASRRARVWLFFSFGNPAVRSFLIRGFACPASRRGLPLSGKAFCERYTNSMP